VPSGRRNGALDTDGVGRDRGQQRCSCGFCPEGTVWGEGLTNAGEDLTDMGGGSD
jgi:hypothetical protein